jgi:GT2 family glycosyltransferase
MLDCTIIIPVFNNAALTAQCLDTVIASSTTGVTFEVVVVDDNSTDGTPDVLARYGDRIRVITHKTNAGFATSCNDGARVASGRYLVFLNNDTIPLPGWLLKLVAYADRNPAATVVGTKMLFPNNTIQHAGVVVCQDRDVRHIYAGFPADHPATNKSRRFQVVTAGCALFRRGPFDQANGFDPEFCTGYEDVDLCLRLGETGHEIHYCHESLLYHLQSVTANQVEKYGEMDRRNHELYMNRWAHRVKPDDFQYYIEDGLLNITYHDLYPFHFELSPDLGLPATAAPSQSAERLLNTRARQVYELLRETVRLSVQVKEAEFNGSAPAANAGPTNGREHSPSINVQPRLVSRGEIRWMSNETNGRVVSVILPVKNGAAKLRDLLPRILAQKTSDQLEIVGVDSGSVDETVNVLREHGATILSIDAQAFNHGLTRNLAAECARGSVFVFLTQSSLPVGEEWLANLLRPLDEDAMVAGVCSRTQPRDDADLLTRKDVLRDPDSSPERQVKTITNVSAYRRLAHDELRLVINFHTQGTAIRADILKKIPFRRVPMGEDIVWAKEVMEAGYKIVHEPAAVTLHSHRYSFLEHFQRHFDDGRINQRVVGREMDEKAVVPLILDLVRDDWRYLKNECGLDPKALEQWQMIAAVRRVAQAAGHWMGVNHDRWASNPLSLFSLEERIRAGVITEISEAIG